MSKVYVRYGMIVDKKHEIISFEQSQWSEKNLTFNTQKRKKGKVFIEKDFYRLLNNAFHGKCMENVRNGLGIEFIKKDDYKKTTIQTTFQRNS